MKRTLALASLAVVLQLVAPSVASAQGRGGAAAQQADATKLYKSGKALFDAGRYQEALNELQSSYAIINSPNTLLFIAHCQEKLNLRVEALATYINVQVDAETRIQEGQTKYEIAKNEAVAAANSLKMELSEISIVARAVPPGSVLIVDGKTQDSAITTSDGTMRASLYHEPGKATITVRPPTGEPISQTADLTAGRKVPVNLVFGVAPPTTGPTGPTPVTTGGGGGSVEQEGIKPPPTATLVAGGIGVVGLGMFAIFGSMASSAASELDACSPNCGSAQRTAQGNDDYATRDGGKRDQTIANVSLFLGSLSLVTAGVLWVVLPREDEGPTAANHRRPPPPGPRIGLRVPPGGVEVVGTF